MDQGALKNLLDSEIDNSIGFLETETIDDRRKALDYYLRRPYGNEIEGRSQIVTGEVAEVIDGALPQLVRVFTASDDIVRFEPKNPGDEEGAKQATEYVNWVFYRDNEGFLVLHNWFKDALLQKTGIVKAYWDDKIEVTKEEYQNLTDDELVLLMADGTREVVEQDTQEIDGGIGMDGQPVVMRSHNVKVSKKSQSGSVQIENVPPEEFLISKRAKDIETAPFVAHRTLMTRSELVAMGFDAKQIDTVPSSNDLTFSQERVSRFDQSEQPDTQSMDESMEEVEVFECYVRADMDDDGIAELRRVVYAGSEILLDEETDYIPFYSICPIPIPHKFFGNSLADRAMDIQLQKSTITRQMLDNLYLTNNARMGVVEGQVNLDDMLSVTPGGVVRIKNPNAIVPLTVPAVANQAFPMLEYLDSVQSKRTGISDMQQGLNPDILQNVTAAAIAATMSASSGKIELIARIFAETGVKSLFKGILHLVTKYQDKPRIIRMRGKYVEIDPRSWSNQYDLSISVGLGTGNKQEQMAMLQMVMSKQEQIIQQYGAANPLVSVGQYRTTLSKFIEAAGFSDTAMFFKEITPEMDQQLSNPPPQEQQQPDPAVQAMIQQSQAQIQIAQQKAMADVEANKQKAIADIQLAREKASAEIQLAREKAAAELELRKAEFQVEAQLKAAKVGAGITSNMEIPG
jgi:hypothetical protein